MKKEFIFIIFLVIILRASMWFLPLVRDAFGYAYIGSRFADNAVLYKDVWDHKPPGVFFLDALVHSVSVDYILGIRLASLLFAVCSTLIFYKLLRELFDKQISLIATLLFGIFTNVYMVTQGDNLVESYMVPILCLTYYVFVKAYRGKKGSLYALTGILLGVLFIFKQVGILPFGAIVLFLLFKKQLDPKRVGLLCLGIGCVVAPFAGYFITKGALGDALDEIFLYNFVYAKQGYSISSVAQSLYYVLQVLFATLLFWVLGLIGLARKKFSDFDILFFLFLAAAIFGASLGGRFAFSRNYFLLVLPSLGFFAGSAIEQIRLGLWKDTFFRKMASITVVCLLIPSVLLHLQAVVSGLYFQGLFNPGEREIMYTLGLSNYNFVKEEKTYYTIADYLKTRVSPEDFILDFGAEPEIYLLTNTKAPTRYFYNFPLNGVFIKSSDQNKKREIFLTEITLNKPKYIVTNKEEGRHKPSFDDLEFAQFKKFLHINYVLEDTLDNYLIFKLKVL